MAITSTKKNCQRKSRKSNKKCRSKSQRGGGIIFDSTDEKVYKQFKSKLVGDEISVLSTKPTDEVQFAKKTMKANLKSLLDNASKIDYQEMLINKRETLM